MAADKKPSIVEYYRALAGLMMRDGEPNALALHVGLFPETYCVTVDNLIVEADQDKIVRISTKRDVAATVAKFIDKIRHIDGWLWTAKQIDGFVDYWFYLAPRIPMPKAWAWPDDEALAFHRIPFLPTDAPTPLWDEIMGRMGNSKAFKTWVGSLFNSKSDRQTYVWLYGEGQNSKGAIIRALERTFGTAYKAEQVPDRRDKFWSYWILGKRLVVFSDTNDVGFPATGFFKSLTGGDTVRMEIKGGASFSSALTAMFLFASNDRPAISSEKADLRRSILCELTAINGDPLVGYEDALWLEMPAFIAKCLVFHVEHGPGAIQSSTEALENWVGSIEDKYQWALNHHITIVKDIDSLQTHEKAHVLATEFTIFVEWLFKDRHDRLEFKKFLERKHRIKRQSVRLPSGAFEGRYVNVQIMQWVAPKRDNSHETIKL